MQTTVVVCIPLQAGAFFTTLWVEGSNPSPDSDIGIVQWLEQQNQCGFESHSFNLKDGGTGKRNGLKIHLIDEVACF
ncbi:hypothetical protein C9994_09865 [Marivirga lumbricoides]|uniref:Uncharacterized protein n=1 Tax=Marivirga lumbricoides TaxID=1046115 RepID=A0A2T4DPX8_9BACT|nr:hypothetical protein C9994_09865 [Marivirga lumbricoides]